MSPILLVVIGVAVVLGGILLVKLHPILALLLGALIVGLLTPDSLLESFAASKGLSPQQTQGLLNQSLGKRIALGFGEAKILCSRRNFPEVNQVSTNQQ